MSIRHLETDSNVMLLITFYTVISLFRKNIINQQFTFGFLYSLVINAHFWFSCNALSGACRIGKKCSYAM